MNQNRSVYQSVEEGDCARDCASDFKGDDGPLWPRGGGYFGNVIVHLLILLSGLCRGKQAPSRRQSGRGPEAFRAGKVQDSQPLHSFSERLLFRLGVVLVGWNVHVALIAAFLAFATHSYGATINAADTSILAVSNAIAIAVDGDTVQIPSGTSAWDNKLFWDKAITVKGMGPYNTILDFTGYTSPDYLLAQVQTDNTKRARIAHLQIKGGTAPSGVILWQNESKLNEVDNVFLNGTAGRYFGCVSISTTMVGGLFHNCRVVTVSGQGPFFNTTVEPNISHASWAEPFPWGTTNMNVYMQSNRITMPATTAITDGRAGQRFVFRFNIVTNGSVETHEFGAAGERGMHCIEMYGNEFYQTDSSPILPAWIRSGNFRGFSNTMAGTWSAAFVKLNGQPLLDPYVVWGQMNGTNAWAQTNRDYTLYGGTHTGGDNTYVLTDSTKSWTINELAGRSIINISSGLSGLVKENTATTVTCVDATFATFMPLWTNGHAYAITNRVVKFLDQPGVSHSVLLSGAALATPTPIGYPHYSNEPVRIWNNTGTGANVWSSEPYQYQIVDGENVTNAAPHDLVVLGEHPLDLKDLDTCCNGGEPSITPGLPAVGISGNVPLNGGVFIR